MSIDRSDRPVESSLPSRAQLPVRDTIQFDWIPVGALLVTLIAALSVARAHLRGHEAGAVSGLLLGLGLVAVVCTVRSVVEYALARRSA